MGYYHSGYISAGNEVILNLPSSVEVLSHRDQNKGIYVTTNSKNVTIIGQNMLPYTSDSFFALPNIELNDTYVYYGISVPPASGVSRMSSVLIVGTENNINFKLRVTQSVNISIGTTVATTLIPGRLYSFVISKLQTVYIGSRQDISGTKIVADRPVSVFSGDECGNVPSTQGYCSHLVEQIPPTALWGKVYYTAPLSNRTSYTIKVLAAYHSTVVNIYCNNSMESYTINEGEFINKTSQMMEYCAIHSNKVVLVVQLSHGGFNDYAYYGDPMMTLVPAVNQYLNKVDFSTIRNTVLSGYEHFVNIIVTAQYYQPNLIYLMTGGVTISLVTHQWIPIQFNSVTEAYATQVRIPEGVIQIFHSNAAAQLMTIVYGFRPHDGYGHIGGFHNHIGRAHISTTAGY